MAKAPEDRFQSCDEMLKQLERTLRGEPTAPVPLSGRTVYGHGVDARRAAGGAVQGTPVSTGSFAVSDPPKRSNGPLLAGVVVVLLLAIAGGGYFALGSGALGGTGSTTTAASLPTTLPDAGASLPDAPPAAPDAPTALPDAGADAGGPRRVTLTIETDPEGARVTIEGRGEVCDTTPCTVEVPVGQEIEIRAVMRRARGSIHVIPLEGMEPIHMRLVARPPSDDEGGGSSGSGSSGSGSSGGSGSGGDLKIPDIFSRPRGGH
jgi:hypothetical protein